MSQRLQKFLANSGIGSRRFCEDLIKEKKIFVNGKVAEIGSKVESGDEIIFEGKKIPHKNIFTKLILLNKPTGVLSSTKREKNIPIVFDYLPDNEDQRHWISVGRLDINTSGLMLFTNDGDFANFCMHPSSQIDREYLVRARGNFTSQKKEQLLKGIRVDGEKLYFSDLVEGQKKGSNQWFSVCLKSGKNREIRKLFNSIEMEVSRLKRTRFGPIFLPSTLKKGKHLMLDEKDIISLKEYGTHQGV